MVIVDDTLFNNCLHKITKLAKAVSDEIDRHNEVIKKLDGQIALTRWELQSSVKSKEE